MRPHYSCQSRVLSSWVFLHKDVDSRGNSQSGGFAIYTRRGCKMWRAATRARTKDAFLAGGFAVSKRVVLRDSRIVSRSDEFLTQSAPRRRNQGSSVRGGAEGTAMELAATEASLSSRLLIVIHFSAAFRASERWLGFCLAKMAREALVAALTATPDADDWVAVADTPAVAIRVCIVPQAHRVAMSMLLKLRSQKPMYWTFRSSDSITAWAKLGFGDQRNGMVDPVVKTTDSEK